MHRHKVDEAYGILRLVHGIADENLAVSSYDKRYRVDESTRGSSRAVRFKKKKRGKSYCVVVKKVSS